MRILLLLVIGAKLLFMTQCDEGECIGESISDINAVPELATFAPLSDTYTEGSVIRIQVVLPDSNDFFGSTISLLEESGDESPTVVFNRGFFEENDIQFRNGRQGEFPERFFMQYDNINRIFTLDMDVRLNRIDDYQLNQMNVIEAGLSDCPDYFVSFTFEGVEGNTIEFSVVEPTP